MFNICNSELQTPKTTNTPTPRKYARRTQESWTAWALTKTPKCLLHKLKKNPTQSSSCREPTFQIYFHQYLNSIGTFRSDGEHVTMIMKVMMKMMMMMMMMCWLLLRILITNVTHHWFIACRKLMQTKTCPRGSRSWNWNRCATEIVCWLVGKQTHRKRWRRSRKGALFIPFPKSMSKWKWKIWLDGGGWLANRSSRREGRGEACCKSKVWKAFPMDYSGVQMSENPLLCCDCSATWQKYRRFKEAFNAAPIK